MLISGVEIDGGRRDLVFDMYAHHAIVSHVIKGREREGGGRGG